jgi:hypothetical protein
MSEEFSEYVLKELGLLENPVKVDPAYAESYRGKLPDGLLNFWIEHGWGSFQEGKFWLCDPKPFKSILTPLFEGDPEFNTEDFLVYFHDAFGETCLWNKKKKNTTIQFYFNQFLFSKNQDLNKYNGEHLSDDFIAGGIIGSSSEAGSWIDEEGNQMFPQALKKAGRLAAGEIYGFVPALSMGGDNVFDNIQRFPLKEHLSFLVSVSEMKLVEYINESTPENPFGHFQTIRPIGRQP